MEGFGNRIKSFELDGKQIAKAAVPYTLEGTHNIRMVLESQDLTESKINKVPNYTAPDTPVASIENGVLSWSSVKGAKSYRILKNGSGQQNITETSIRVPEQGFREYQVVAVDSNQVSSFASEPILVPGNQAPEVVQVEDFAAKSGKDYKDFEGKGFVELSKTVNRSITIPIEIKEDGTYAISFRYANGNGPINTENKCAIRTLKADGNFAGTVVLPQRGKNEWSNWGFSNYIHTDLTKGKHTLTISFEPSNENMNGEINQAMLDAVYLYRME
jgi:hypothetical protein